MLSGYHPRSCNPTGELISWFPGRTGDTAVAVAAVGPAEAHFAAAGPGRQSAVLRSAGAYMLSATFGGLLASGWPKALDVKAAYGSSICCVVKGDALSGVDCGQPASLTLSSADQFGNPRCE